MSLARVLVFAAALACSTGCSGTEPVPSIVGTWNVVGFRSDGVTATASGTMTFSASGTVSANVIITFPGEPADTVIDTGTFTQAGRLLTLTMGGDTGEWDLAFSGDTVVLQLLNDASASRLTLQQP